MTDKLTGQVAIITGASKGIGRAIAERLASDGAAVVVNYAHSKEKAESVVKAIESNGGKAIAIKADISQPGEVKHLFDDAEKHLGALNILVNNAGAIVSKPIVETTLEDFDKVVSINVRGTFLALQEGARRIQNQGRIINIATTSTLLSSPGQSVYAASKAAVEQFSRVAAKELGERKITVNSVSPGATDTDMMLNDIREMVLQQTPLNRIGQPEDIADVVAFLASDDARWITGQTIYANGGML
ncbi:SDR family oxidoreductase [Mastigocoleus testarum]|uniref:3-ketoacyl-ACP reductase n=1 Tax=Mastigocoleus testarum BC008 TaxID=371196 RepID=A0A0V7ZNA8_9CYAN|nr:SDR family oxidoreductase [Mastigocoleus testarum]KST66181.1 3-ketoacyl-ACP reductase [Mastigocoleus testarum BC008]